MKHLIPLLRECIAGGNIAVGESSLKPIHALR